MDISVMSITLFVLPNYNEPFVLSTDLITINEDNIYVKYTQFKSIIQILQKQRTLNGTSLNYRP